MQAFGLKWIWPATMPCVFRLLTGLYCPGCGGTRAVLALLTGRPLVSFLYHPLVLYCVVLAVWFAVSYLLYRRTGKQVYRRYLENRYVYAGVLLTAVNFLVKNYFLLIHGVDILARLPQAVP